MTVLPVLREHIEVLHMLKECMVVLPVLREHIEVLPMLKKHLVVSVLREHIEVLPVLRECMVVLLVLREHIEVLPMLREHIAVAGTCKKEVLCLMLDRKEMERERPTSSSEAPSLPIFRTSQHSPTCSEPSVANKSS